MDTLTLIPAYGKDYTRVADVKAAWKNGEDFKIASYGPDMGRYINKPDFDKFGSGHGVMIRYAKLEKVVYITK